MSIIDSKSPSRAPCKTQEQTNFEGTVHRGGLPIPFLRIIYCSSLVISLLLSAFWYIDAGRESPHTVKFAMFQALLLGALAGGWWTIGFLERRKLPANWFLSIAMLNIMIVAPELLLRIVEFRHETGIQFGYPRPSHFHRFTPDNSLFWTYDPAEPGVNSWGFHEREILPNGRQKGITRVLFLGDSCTEQGYPQIAVGILNENEAEQSIDGISLAISGYSSFQGRWVAENYGPIVQPDIVVIYFGWNDHWQAYENVDSRKIVPKQTKIRSRIISACSRSRLIQFIQFMGSFGKRDEPLSEQRVSYDEYYENLIAIYRVFKSLNAHVIFITAPTSHYALGVPDYLTNHRFLAKKESGISLHKRYNEAVRTVQRECPKSTLCDLERSYTELSNGELRKIFTRDGIHFTNYGLKRVANDVSQVIRQVGRGMGNSPVRFQP